MLRHYSFLVASPVLFPLLSGFDGPWDRGHVGCARTDYIKQSTCGYRDVAGVSEEYLS